MIQLAADGKLPVPGLKNAILKAYPLAAPATKLATLRENGTAAVRLEGCAKDQHDTVLGLN